MLKIKDGVYLRALFPLGFKQSNNFIYKPRKDTDIPLITIDIKTRIISIQGICDRNNTVEDTLYSLFEADLVERIENYN